MTKESFIFLFNNPSKSLRIPVNKPSTEPVRPSKGLKKDLEIDAETLLSLLYFANGKTIHVPKMSAARRLIRNENLLKDYKNGVVYAELAQKYGISQRWVRHLCKTIPIHCKYL